MVPTAFDEANVVLDKPAGVDRDDCEALGVLRARDARGWPVVISCWKMTREELDEVNRTGRIWLVIAGETMPMVSPHGIKPFGGEYGQDEAGQNPAS